MAGLGNKKIFSANLQRYMEANGKTRNDICKELGFSYSTFSEWVNGIKYPRIDKIEMLANYFGIKKSDLIEVPSTGQSEQNNNEYLFSKFSNLMPVSKHRIPLLGEIACGEPIFADEDRESYVEAGTDIQADFCLRAKGDSMIGARIMDGDIVFVRKQDIVENGEIAVVIIDDEATLKRVYYYPEQGKLLLMSENPAYEPFIYVGEELNEIHILGKAIAFQSDIK